MQKGTFAPARCLATRMPVSNRKDSEKFLTSCLRMRSEVHPQNKARKTLNPIHKAQRTSTPRNLHWTLGPARAMKAPRQRHHCIAKAWNWHSAELRPAAIPSCAIKAAMFMPRLLKEAKKKSRLMGLSNPLPRRKVDKMKRMPRRENTDVTLSAIMIALSWLRVAWRSMMGDCLLGGREGQLSAKAGVVVACTQLVQTDSPLETVDDGASSGMSLKETRQWRESMAIEGRELIKLITEEES